MACSQTMSFCGSAGNHPSPIHWESLMGFGVFFPFVNFSKSHHLPASHMKHEKDPSLPASATSQPLPMEHVLHPFKNKHLLCSPSRRQWYAAMSFSSCCLLVSRFSRSLCCCSVSTLISPISASSLEMTEPRFCSSMSCQCLASYKEFSRPLFCKGGQQTINQLFSIYFIVNFIQVWPISLLTVYILRIPFFSYLDMRYYHYKSWSTFTRCRYSSYCLVLHYQAISVRLSMNILKIEIWSLVVKCGTLRAPFQSREAQKCLASLETGSGGKWDSFLTLHPKTGMFPSEGWVCRDYTHWKPRIPYQGSQRFGFCLQALYFAGSFVKLGSEALHQLFLLGSHGSRRLSLLLVKEGNCHHNLRKLWLSFFTYQTGSNIFTVYGNSDSKFDSFIKSLGWTILDTS